MHSTSINGTATDLGTYQKNLPVVSPYNSTFLVNDSIGYSEAGGNNVTLYNSGMTSYYAHLQEGSIAYNALKQLNNSAHSSNVWRFTIPMNYQIGNVGNTGGKTTGMHLHYQTTRW